MDIPARRQRRRLPLQGLDVRRHRAPLRASRLTLRSLLLRSVRPARRGRPSRRCCAPAPGSPVNRTPHETLDHPTVAFCRTAKGLESSVMRAGPVRCCRPMLAAPVRSSAPPASRRVPCFPAPSARRGAGALFAAKLCPPNRAVDRRQGRVFHCRPRYTARRIRRSTECCARPWTPSRRRCRASPDATYCRAASARDPRRRPLLRARAGFVRQQNARPWRPAGPRRTVSPARCGRARIAATPGTPKLPAARCARCDRCRGRAAADACHCCRAHICEYLPWGGKPYCDSLRETRSERDSCSPSELPFAPLIAFVGGSCPSAAEAEEEALAVPLGISPPPAQDYNAAMPGRRMHDGQDRARESTAMPRNQGAQPTPSAAAPGGVFRRGWAPCRITRPRVAPLIPKRHRQPLSGECTKPTRLIPLTLLCASWPFPLAPLCVLAYLCL